MSNRIDCLTSSLVVMSSDTAKLLHSAGLEVIENLYDPTARTGPYIP